MTRVQKVTTNKWIIKQEPFFLVLGGVWYNYCKKIEGFVAYSKASKCKTSLHYISIQASSFTNLHEKEKTK